MFLLGHSGRGGHRRPYSIVLIAAACAVALSVPAAHANATSGRYRLQVHLKPTATTIGAPRARGAFSATLKLAGKDSSLTWTLKFRHLSGRALRAGIYFRKAAKTSQLAMLLCNKCRSGSVSYYRGLYVATPTFVQKILQQRAYVIIQTKRNPKGEIRGRIKVTPL